MTPRSRSPIRDATSPVACRAKVYKVKLPAGKYQIEIMSTRHRSRAGRPGQDRQASSLSTTTAAKASTRGCSSTPPRKTPTRCGRPPTKAPAISRSPSRRSATPRPAPRAGAEVPKQGLKVEGNIKTGEGTVTLALGNDKKNFAGNNHIVKLIDGKKYQIDLVKQDESLDPLLILQDANGKMVGRR